MSSSRVVFLRDSQNADGGWGYLPAQTSAVEATAAVALALRGESAAGELYRGALAWLDRLQHGDGGWGVGPSDRESGWATAWAVWALTGSGFPPDAAARGVEWLLAVKTSEPGSDDDIQRTKQTLGIDPTLRGWSWWPGEATWVEPTALTVLALASLPSTPAIQDRIAEAVRYLVDRRCREGGWNVGNPVMFSQALPPRAHPTALAVLALSRAAPEQLRPEDLSALRADMRSDGGALALASGLLALRERGEEDPSAAGRLAELQQADGSWNSNVYHTAFALMAERGGI